MSRVKSPHLFLLGLAAAALSAAGCASMHGGPLTLWRWDDPPHLAPGSRIGPSYDSVPPAAGQVQRPVAPSPEFPAPRPAPTPAPADLPPPIEGFDGPRIVPPTAIQPARVELAVQAPRQAQVDSGIVYRITVSNMGDEPADDLVVEARLDEGLVFPGRADSRVTQALGTLGPRDRREIALTLVGQRPGLLCCEFLVTSRGGEIEWKSVCVDVTPRRLSVTIVGPPRRTTGSRAEFNVKLANVADRTLQDVKLALSYDPELAPRESSAGVRQEPGSLHWYLGDLEPGEGVQVQVEFDVHSAGDPCLAAQVSGDNFPDDRVEACLRVAPPGALDLHVADRDDPIRVGDETEYVVTVHNRAAREARQVRVTAHVPDSFRIAAVAVEQAGRRLELPHRVEGQEILFDPLPELPPGTAATYRIVVEALRPGDAAFRAEASHAAAPAPVESIEPTTVNP